MTAVVKLLAGDILVSDSLQHGFKLGVHWQVIAFE